jgi:glycosyltransferase involved in cell wall biosynthesis
MSDSAEVSKLHIGFCGPATLEALSDLVNQPIEIQGYPFRGSATLIREYLALGHRVTLFTTSPDISAEAVFAGPNLRIVAVPTRFRGHKRAFDFFAVERKSLIACIRRERPDVLHANWTYEFGLAARQSGLPTVVTVHDWAPSVARSNKHPYWYFRWLMQIWCLSYRGALTAPSEYIAARVSRVFRKPCIVIPNGIDIASFHLADKHPGVTGYRIGMLNVGFSDRKNVQCALQAWATIRDLHPSATLVAAGPGYEQNGEAHRWATANNVDSQVDFVGNIGPNAVPEWYASLNAFLHPSIEESFGMVLLEAMAAGLPVIAGQKSGAVPAVTGGNALLTDVTSSTALAADLHRVLADDVLRSKLSAKGLRWSENFSVSASAIKFIEVLKAASSRG